MLPLRKACRYRLFMVASERYDIIIAGGGLAGGLAAMALKRAHPEIRLALVEAGDTLGGNHLWSCFATDLDEESRALVAPLFAYRWSGHQVAFPAHHRTLPGDYASIPSTHFDRVVRRALGEDAVLSGRKVVDITPVSVTLDDGATLSGPVMDCRGAGNLDTLDCGWQKFVGRVIRCVQPHGVTQPTIMDATVEQIDGYRFVYVLPFSATELFIEDTYYSDTPDLDIDTLRVRIAEYAAAKGWSGGQANHEETGVLPVVTGGDFEAYWQSGGPGIAKGGVRAGLFQPLTSYSLPEATRFAIALAKAWPIATAEALHAWTHDHAKARWQANRYYRMLGTMLFRAAERAQRYKILERFYRLPEPLIGRFYAGQSTIFDKARILLGKPPVPIGRAITALIGKSS